MLFFARRQKLKGTAAFFSGLLLIIFRWPLIGFLVELYGIFILFGDFLGTVAGFARNIPVVGTWIGVFSGCAFATCNALGWRRLLGGFFC